MLVRKVVAVSLRYISTSNHGQLLTIPDCAFKQFGSKDRDLKAVNREYYQVADLIALGFQETDLEIIGHPRSKA